METKTNIPVGKGRVYAAHLALLLPCRGPGGSGARSGAGCPFPMPLRCQLTLAPSQRASQLSRKRERPPVGHTLGTSGRVASPAERPSPVSAFPFPASAVHSAVCKSSEDRVCVLIRQPVHQRLYHDFEASPHFFFFFLAKIGI